MPPDSAGEQLWTVEQACAYFARGGLPVEADTLTVIIREIRKTPGGRDRLPAMGETPPGPAGGRGKALYRARDLMLLHRDLAPWVAHDGEPGPSPPVHDADTLPQPGRTFSARVLADGGSVW
jgi:hypothetical protein